MLIILALASAGLVGLIIYTALPRAPARPAVAQQEEANDVPAYHKSTDEAKPLPATLDPERFKQPAVVQAYRVAKEIPEVLAQQPCYCRCDRQGHRSLIDCFATEHAVTCNICLKEAILAGQMYQAGKKPEDIRAAMIRGDWTGVQLR